MEMEMDFDSISNLENRQKTLFKIKQSKMCKEPLRKAFASFWAKLNCGLHEIVQGKSFTMQKRLCRKLP